MGESYNIGTGRATTVMRLHSILAHLVGTKKKAVFSSARAGDIIRSCADTTKARRKLSYRPKIDLEMGLKSLVSDLRNVVASP